MIGNRQVYSNDSIRRLSSRGNGESLSYDRNGNVTSLIRTGDRAETLVYTYTSGTNKLGTLKVNGTSKTYAYNGDGTMSTDGLRGLTVTYNSLKLPKQVKASSNTGTVDYVYDALGNKLAVRQGGTLKNVYCGDFVYNTSLAVDYILTPNGQLTRNPSTGAYTAQYNITDHLGNVRSVVNSSGTVLQSTDYYPFGLAFSDANITNNRYLYNGKELEDYTIGTSYLGTLDYGARHYDPRIARWTVPDPMAEKYYCVSTFTYGLSNPLLFEDYNGEDSYRFDKKTGEITLFENNDDPYDKLVTINNRGKRTVEIDNIERGILKDGLNLKFSDYVVKVGSENTPSLEAVEQFIIDFSDLIDKEIGGYYLSDKGSESINYVKISKYCSNTDTKAIPGSPYTSDINGSIADIKVNFHTHLSKFPDNYRLVPSGIDNGGGDIGFKDRQVKILPNLQFLIITKPNPFYF